MITPRLVRLIPRRPRPLAPTLERLEPRSLLVSALTLQGTGPIERLVLGDDASFQVLRFGDLHGPVFAGENTPGDAGFFVRPRLPDGSTAPVVGLDVVGRRALGWRTTATASASTGWHPILFQPDSDGLGALLIADNRDDRNTSGLAYQLVQHVRLIPGSDAFRVDAALVNLGATTLTLDAFAAADLYLDDRDPTNDFAIFNDDFGFGWYDPATGAAGGTDFLGANRFAVAPNPDTLALPDHFQAGHFSALWRAIGTGADLSDTALLRTLDPPSQNDPHFVNNAAALQWADLAIAPGASLRLSYSWSFGAPANGPLADAPSVAPLPVAATAGVPFQGTLARFTPTALATTAADYLATISWGDGSPTSTATISPDPAGSGFLVAATHTFPRPGLFPVTITVVGPEGAASSARATATVAHPGGGPPPPTPGTLNVSGALDPASDLGASNTDAITSDPQPRFFGRANPGSSITLFATNLASGLSTTFSTTTAADGSWSALPPAPLADGRYTIRAEARLDGLAAQTTLLDPAKPLVIDTRGPRVVALSATPRAGRIVVAFDDLGSALDLSTLGQSANYRLVRRVQGGNRDFALRVAEAGPGRVVLATRRLPTGRGYTFTVLAGVRDLAGNTLDGRFAGRFPSGDGRPGTPFQAALQAGNLNLLSIRPLAATRSSRPRRG